MWIDLCDKPKNVKIFMSQVSAQHSVTSVEEDFNCQVDRITHSVATIQSFFPATLPLPNGLMQSGHDGKNGGYPCTQQQRLPLINVYLVMVAVECGLPATDQE